MENLPTLSSQQIRVQNNNNVEGVKRKLFVNTVVSKSSYILLYSHFVILVVVCSERRCLQLETISFEAKQNVCFSGVQGKL